MLSLFINVVIHDFMYVLDGHSHMFSFNVSNIFYPMISLMFSHKIFCIFSFIHLPFVEKVFSKVFTGIQSPKKARAIGSFGHWADSGPK